MTEKHPNIDHCKIDIIMSRTRTNSTQKLPTATAPKPADLVAIIDAREPSIEKTWDLSPMRMERGTLYTGDFSLKGMESLVTCERKELSDAVACCGNQRERFEREIQRLKGFQFHLVIVEASWSDIFEGNWRSKLAPKQVFSSLTAWAASGLNICMAGDRQTAARICRASLFYFARYRLKEIKPLIQTIQANTSKAVAKQTNTSSAKDGTDVERDPDVSIQSAFRKRSLEQ